MTLFKNKKVLVTGGTGMVGQQLVPKLIQHGAKVFVSSLDHKSLVNQDIDDFYQLDLSNLDNCIKIMDGKNIVINLLGVTGSPMLNETKPATFMMSNLYCAINPLMAAQISGVENYLYTSTYGVYAPSKIMTEEDVWKTFPSEHDKYAGWAKRIGELQVEAYKKEYNFKSIHIVRPANIYGPFANFNPESSMVVSSLIKRVEDGENPIKVWGDGSSIRDFIYSSDVADAMISVMEKNIQNPINIGSGVGVSIKELIETIISIKNDNSLTIDYDLSKPKGDLIRILDTSYAQKNNIKPSVSLREGLSKTIDWYKNNKDSIEKRFNHFK